MVKKAKAQSREKRNENEMHTDTQDEVETMSQILSAFPADIVQELALECIDSSKKECQSLYARTLEVLAPAMQDAWRNARDVFERECPYCLVRLNDGRWLPLGRQYKPLGQVQTGAHDYEQYAASSCDEARKSQEQAHHAFQSLIDPHELKGAWTATAKGRLWLYRAGTLRALPDFEAYASRVAAVLDELDNAEAIPVTLRLIGVLQPFVRDRQMH